MKDLVHRLGLAPLASLFLACVALPVVAQSAPSSGSNQSQASVQGLWLTEGGKFVIHIAPCSTELCGTIIRNIAAETNPKESPTTGNNGQPIVGWNMLRAMAQSMDGDWHGSMHNVVDGKSYSCTMRLESTDVLWVRAYIGIPLFGKDHHWTRMEQPKEPTAGTHHAT